MNRCCFYSVAYVVLVCFGEEGCRESPPLPRTPPAETLCQSVFTLIQSQTDRKGHSGGLKSIFSAKFGSDSCCCLSHNLLYICRSALPSWDHVHLWQRRRPHFVQLASQREAEYQDRQADRWFQHLPERRHPGPDRQRTWSGGLSDAAHSEYSHVLPH